MRSLKKRNPVLFAFLVALGLMALSSSAWACTVFKGKMTVTGNSATPGTSTVVGNNLSMGYCQLTPGANAKNTSGTVTITVTSAAAPCTVSSLNANTAYDANYTNGPAFAKVPPVIGVYKWVLDCMSPTGGTVQSMTPATVTTNASGGLAATTFSIPGGINNNVGEDSAVCLSTPGGGNGNQAPVHIVTL